MRIGITPCKLGRWLLLWALATLAGWPLTSAADMAPVEAAGGGLRIAVPHLSYLRGETMPIQVSSTGAGSVVLTLHPEAQRDDPEASHLVAQLTAGESTTVTFNTGDVHPGLWELRAALRDPLGNYRAAVDLDLALVTPRPRRIRLGAVDLAPDQLRDANLDGLAAQGFDVVYYPYTNPTAPEGLRDLIDMCFRHGLLSAPVLEARSAIRWNDTLDAPRAQATLDATKWAQLLSPSRTPVYDSANYPVLCPRNPRSQALMERYVGKLAQGAAQHPGVAELALDRDAALAFDWRGLGAGCFCEHCVRFFEEQTGTQAPQPKYVEPGHVADGGDAYAAWLQLLGAPRSQQGGTMEFYNKRLKGIVANLDPALPVVQLPGGVTGELDAATYLVNFERHQTVETKMAYLMDLARARQRQNAKPIHVVLHGLDADPEAPQLDARLALLSRLAVSRGATEIDFGPHAATTTAPVALALAQVRSLADRLGPMLVKLKFERKPIAVLYSDTTVGYQQLLRWQEARQRWETSRKWFEEPWEHEHSFYLGYSALLKNGLPVEIVTEPQVLAGELDRYNALILIDHEYSTKPLEEKIRAFQESGKLVFADESSVVRPPRCLNIPTDFSVWSQMIPLGLRSSDPAVADIVRRRQVDLIREAAHYVDQAVSPHVQRPVEVTPHEVMCSTATNGDSQYVLLVNPDLLAPTDATVSLETENQYVYDLDASRRHEATYADGRLQFQARIDPGGLRVFLLSWREITHLRVRPRREGDLLVVEVSVGGEAGLRVSGSHPVQLTFTDAAGARLPESGFYATSEGRLRLEIPLAKVEPLGQWTLAVQDLASGLTRTQQFSMG